MNVRKIIGGLAVLSAVGVLAAGCGSSAAAASQPAPASSSSAAHHHAKGKKTKTSDVRVRGRVTSISSTSLTLTTKKDKTKVFVLTSGTAYQQHRKTILPSLVKVGNSVVVVAKHLRGAMIALKVNLT